MLTKPRLPHIKHPLGQKLTTYALKLHYLSVIQTRLDDVVILVSILVAISVSFVVVISVLYCIVLHW